MNSQCVVILNKRLLKVKFYNSSEILNNWLFNVYLSY